MSKKSKGREVKSTIKKSKSRIGYGVEDKVSSRFREF